jgi:hypothetical protein
MSENVRAWLAGRRPRPAFDLAPWLEGAEDAASTSEALGRLSGRALDLTLSAPGRVRESALNLLAADALITYACEAALEREDPEKALAAILDEVSER